MHPNPNPTLSPETAESGQARHAAYGKAASSIHVSASPPSRNLSPVLGGGVAARPASPPRGTSLVLAPAVPWGLLREQILPAGEQMRRPTSLAQSDSALSTGSKPPLACTNTAGGAGHGGRGGRGGELDTAKASLAAYADVSTLIVLGRLPACSLEPPPSSTLLSQ